MGLWGDLRTAFGFDDTFGDLSDDEVTDDVLESVGLERFRRHGDTMFSIGPLTSAFDHDDDDLPY